MTLETITQVFPKAQIKDLISLRHCWDDHTGEFFQKQISKISQRHCWDEKGSHWPAMAAEESLNHPELNDENDDDGRKRKKIDTCMID